MSSIKYLFHIAAPRDKVYTALNSIEGLSNWWTVQTSGECKVGSSIEFRFTEPWIIGVTIIKLVENETVTWKCIAGSEDWIGTIINFQLDENEGKTRLRFEHTGWEVTGDFYASCAYSWARYLESLRQLCQTGTGEAFGSPNYRG